MGDAGLPIHHEGKNLHMYAYANLYPDPLRSIDRNDENMERLGALEADKFTGMRGNWANLFYIHILSYHT